MYPSDFYTHHEVVPIAPFGAQYPGTLVATYEVHRYTDVRNLQARRGYIITASVRTVYPNPNYVNDLGATSTLSYEYPAMLIASLSLGAEEGAKLHGVRLIDVSPKTLDSAVSTNRTTSATTSGTLDFEHTSGSSTSTTNDYSMGVIPSSSKTKTKFSSNSFGAAGTAGTGAATSDTMSVKDWVSCVAYDEHFRAPSWVWAQAFPWDVLQYHNQKKLAAGGVVSLPTHVRALLSDLQNNVYPPSQIAMFGLNFVMYASWFYPADDESAVGDTVFATTSLQLLIGSHTLSPPSPSPSDDTDPAPSGLGKLTVTLNSDQYFRHKTEPLDLSLLALDPIDADGEPSSATIGFVESKFVVKPYLGRQFRIASNANTLLIRGAGFALPAAPDEPMTATLDDGKAILDVYFKIADEDADHQLFIKHWLTTDVGCVMTIVVNGGPPITRHVDSREAGSGSDNIITVMLRRKTYSSDEYYDYLVMGLNKIVITIERAQSTTTDPCGYAIRALAIA